MSVNKEELNALWFAYKQQKRPELRNQLVQHYMHLVKIVAGKIAMGLPPHIDRDDLISNGFIGLLDAVDRFDPGRGTKFESYAVTRIKGAILDALRTQDWLPNSLRQKARRYETVVADLENKLMRSATDEEIAAAMQLSLEEYNEMLTQLSAAAMMPLEDYIQAETVTGTTQSPVRQVEINEVKQTLANAIERLPEKERLVVSLYYYEDLTLKEISHILNLSEARISQLHTKAIFRLRGALSRLKWSLL